MSRNEGVEYVQICGEILTRKGTDHIQLARRQKKRTTKTRGTGRAGMWVSKTGKNEKPDDAISEQGMEARRRYQRARDGSETPLLHRARQVHLRTWWRTGHDAHHGQTV